MQECKHELSRWYFPVFGHIGYVRTAKDAIKWNLSMVEITEEGSNLG